MVTKKGTPVKKTKDIKIAANVMADSIKTEEKAKAEIKTEITPQTKEKVEAKVEKAAADSVEKITKKAVKGVSGRVPNISGPFRSR